MKSTEHAGNDRERLGRWVQDHAPAVRGFLLALVREADVADDLLQETFRRAWQARERYIDQGCERGYLLRIADRLAVDYSRRRGMGEVTLDEEAWQAAQPLSRSESPEQGVLIVEQQKLLEASLAMLSEPQRRVLLLRFYGDWEFTEIAEQLGCPLGTVLSHCHRALGKLRKNLAHLFP